MKTIFRVAKTELRTLFYSPIAWFLMIVFMIQCGMVYIDALKTIAKTQEFGGIGAMFLSNITGRVFLGGGGLFRSVMQNLYLYIPLLTMSLISRETGSGTIKLLYSSPVKMREIVLGKYLAMLVYSLILVAIVSIFIISGIFHIQYPETAMLMTGMLGFFLLLCAYSAIGLFMSTLTTYQVIAAICTFVMIGILSYIGNLWQRIAFVRELTYFLSINGRAQKLLMGMVTTKDLIYFVVIVYMFLGFSTYKLRDGRESKPWTVKALRYVAVTVIGLLVGYVSSIPGLVGYYDATINKTNTITPKVQGVLKDLGSEALEITAYANLVDQMYYNGNPDSYNDNLARWEPYMRFKSNIKLKTISYYDSALTNPYLFQTYPGKSLKEIADLNAKRYDADLSDYLTPQEIRKVIDLRPESNRYVMQLKWKGEKAWLRVFDDLQVWPSETEIATALKRLQKAKLPKVAFVTGDMERDIDNMGAHDYKLLTNRPTFRHSLVNQGFDVESVVLDSQEIPADIAVLVLADPKLALSDNATAKLTQYINKGGNLLIAGEPGRQAMVNPLLKELGVQMNDGLLIQESRNEPNLILTNITPFAGTFYKMVEKAAKDSVRVSMTNAAGLTWSDTGAFVVQPLLRTSPKSWNRMKPFDPEMMMSARIDTAGGFTKRHGEGHRDGHRAGTQGAPQAASKAAPQAGGGQGGPPGVPPEMMAKIREQMLQRVRQGMPQKATQGTLQRTPQGAAQGRLQGMPQAQLPGNSRKDLGVISFSPADGDVKGPVTSVISLTRKINNKEQRIIVAGDADFISNGELGRYGMANLQFSTGIFRWLGGGEYPLETTRPDARDKKLNVTIKQIDRLKVIYVWIVPAILALFAAILLIRRKRK